MDRIKQAEQRGYADEANSMNKGKTAGQPKWDKINYNLFSGKKGQPPDDMGDESSLWRGQCGTGIFLCIFLSVDDFQ